MRDFKLLAALVLAALVVVFILQNAAPVDVAFLAWTWTASRAIVLLTVFLLGAATGWLARAAHRRRQ